MKKSLLILPLTVFFQASCVAKPIEANTVIALTMGDRACYVKFKDNNGGTHEAMANFEICEQENVLHKKVIFSYSETRVMAAECQGDPECTKSDTVKLISSIRMVDE